MTKIRVNALGLEAVALWHLQQGSCVILVSCVIIPPFQPE